MSSINSEFSKYPGLIRRIESALGTTKTNEIARLLKVSSSLVSDWRAKRSIPGLPQLLETARRGHTTVDWLLTGGGLRTLTVSADDEDTELLNVSERAFIETAARRSKEPITHTLRALIHDGLAARGYTRYAVDVIGPVLACLDSFPEPKRARTAELLGMALAARLRGRVQDWSLRPSEWQSISDIDFNASPAGSDARSALSKLRLHLNALSSPRAKGDGFPESHMRVVVSHMRTSEMPLMGEITASGTIKPFRVSKTVKVPDMFSRNKGRAYYALRARGNSMAGDGIAAGTLLIYKEQRVAHDGQMVVGLVDGHLMVNWFYHDGRRLRLQPLNPNHSPFYVEPEQQLEVKGIIIGIVQPPR